MELPRAPRQGESSRPRGGDPSHAGQKIQKRQMKPRKLYVPEKYLLTRNAAVAIFSIIRRDQRRKPDFWEAPLSRQEDLFRKAKAKHVFFRDVSGQICTLAHMPWEPMSEAWIRRGRTLRSKVKVQIRRPHAISPPGLFLTVLPR